MPQNRGIPFCVFWLGLAPAIIAPGYHRLVEAEIFRLRIVGQRFNTCGGVHRSQVAGNWMRSVEGCETGDETPKADPNVSALLPSIVKTHPRTRPHPPGDVEAIAAHQVALLL